MSQGKVIALGAATGLVIYVWSEWPYVAMLVGHFLTYHYSG
jgi:hypothetical protein